MKRGVAVGCNAALLRLAIQLISHETVCAMQVDKALRRMTARETRAARLSPYILRCMLGIGLWVHEAEWNRRVHLIGECS